MLSRFRGGAEVQRCRVMRCRCRGFVQVQLCRGAEAQLVVLLVQGCRCRYGGAKVLECTEQVQMCSWAKAWIKRGAPRCRAA